MNTTLFILFAIIFLILDIAWIQIFSIMFGPMIEKIQNSPMIVNKYAALAAYIVMIISFYFLIFNDPSNPPSYFKAAILGFAIYGTYEFTNMTTFKNWDLNVLIIDISWGVFVSVFSLYLANQTKSYLKL
jgi:uncharacterized membrane protein